MRYTYEALFTPEDNGYYLVKFYDLPDGFSMTQGRDLADAVYMAADLLKLAAEESTSMPKPSYGHTTNIQGACVIAVSVEALNKNERPLSAAEAAKELGISPARVSVLLADGILKGQRKVASWEITRESVEARKKAPKRPGRPRKTNQA